MTWQSLRLISPTAGIAVNSIVIIRKGLVDFEMTRTGRFKLFRPRNLMIVLGLAVSFDGIELFVALALRLKEVHR